MTKSKLKKRPALSFSSQAKITVKGPIIPVNKISGELKPSTPSNNEIPNSGAHTYSSIKL